MALVAGIPLYRAALKGATSSPTGVQMRVRSVAEKFEGKSLEARADLQFPRRLPNDYPIFYSSAKAALW